MKKIISLLIVSLVFLASCGNNNKDIINPDAEFLYFYGATCPHCQELNKRVEQEDLFSKISVEKREVYYNNDNREKFLEVTKGLGLESSKVGVPFVVHKESGEYSVGVDKALELFKKDFSKVMEESPLEDIEIIEVDAIDEEVEQAENIEVENTTWTGAQ